MFFVILPTSRINWSTCIDECSVTMTHALCKFPSILIPEGVLRAKNPPQKPCVCPMPMLQRICRSIYVMEVAIRTTVCLDTMNRLRLENRETHRPENHLTIVHCIADSAESISLFLLHVWCCSSTGLHMCLLMDSYCERELYQSFSCLEECEHWLKFGIVGVSTYQRIPQPSLWLFSQSPLYHEVASWL